MLAFDPASDTDRLALARAARRATSRTPALLVTGLAALFAWTSHAPADALLYWLWASPVLVGGALLYAGRKALPLSPLAQLQAALLSAFLLCAGRLPQDGAATLDLFAAGPLVLTPELLALARAFAIGFASAVLVREILLRRSPLLPGRWLAFLTVCVCLGLFEVLGVLAWAAHGLLARPPVELALAAPWEFLLVYAGAASALVTLTRRHDAQIQELWIAFTPALDWRRPDRRAA